jgi:tripartite-type tricarboxylate transporter receptor subunit TctC
MDVPAKEAIMLTRRRFVTASATALASAAAGFTPRAFAQTLQKNARIVVGFPPGGSTDVVARLIAERMRGGYAPAVIVENRPGAGGRIALDHMKNAESDGSAMVLTPASMIMIYPHIYKKLSYDPLADFAPVTRVVTFVFAVSVGPAVPESVKTVAELMQWLKANPKQASYGSPAAGSVPHFTGVLLGRAAGVELTHVAFKGGAPAIQDLIGGQIPMSVNVLSEALPQHKAGKLRILATTGPERSRYLPDAPTLKESGFDLASTEWFGIFVPVKTSAETIAKLNAAIREALKSKEVTDGFAKFAFEPAGESPAEFAKLVKSEYERWAPIVKSTGFTAED